MEFLRSVIADARPRKPKREFSVGPSAIAGWETRGSGGDASKAEGESPSAANQTGGLSESLSIQEGAAEEGTGQLGVDETMSLPAEGNALAQREVAGATVTDDRRHSDSSIKDPERLTSQAEEKQTTALTSAESSRRIESSVLRASLESSVPSPDASENPTPDTAVAAKDALGDVQLVSRRAMAMDSHIFSDMELATVSQSAGKEASTSASSRRSESSKSGSPVQHIAMPAKPSASPEALRSVPVRSESSKSGSPVQHIAMPAKLSASPEALRSVPASSESSKSGSPVQHIAMPAKLSASPEALRSVPARPFQADLMPKDGDSFHSRAPLRSPEKKHEAPKVQIGQIDVIIEAAAQPATKPTPASAPIDLASRHYLRRL